jgi:hypothetical protein
MLVLRSNSKEQMITKGRRFLNFDWLTIYNLELIVQPFWRVIRSFAHPVAVPSLAEPALEFPNRESQGQGPHAS